MVQWRGEIELSGDPVPILGKGTESWNVGEDTMDKCVYSDVMSIDETVQMFVSSVLRRRQRYGGKNWKPSLPRISRDLHANTTASGEPTY